jgi:hypothetical protein
MSSPVVHAVTLACHPETPGSPVRGIRVHVRSTPGRLAITYLIEGQLARMRVPPPRSPRIAHGLWQCTCCECFVALDGEPGYHEFNFAPSGEWAAYAFAKYREGEALADEALNPRIAVRRSDDRLELDASIALDRLSATHPSARLTLALSAVIEDEGGALSYWALRHPEGKPDFHHRDSFALNLPHQGGGDLLFARLA